MATSTLAIVVEDEPLIRMELVDILESEGITVLETWSGDAALRILETRGPVDLLLTDVHMPGALDGVALAHEVKRRWPGTAVIICSGQLVNALRALPQGARFVDKPFSTELMVGTIRASLGED